MPIPSHSLARDYLAEVASKFSEGKIIVGGHSKGGNTAVFGAATNSTLIGARISTIYSFDGPGFQETVLKTDEFRKASAIIKKFIPQTSIVGTLFLTESEPCVVCSDAELTNQHNPFTWLTDGSHFLQNSELTVRAKVISGMLNGVIDKLSAEDKARITDFIFDTFEKTGAESFTGFRSIMIKNIPMLLGELTSLDEETADAFKEALLHAFASAFSSVPAILINNAKSSLGFGRNEE